MKSGVRLTGDYAKLLRTFGLVVCISDQKFLIAYGPNEMMSLALTKMINWYLDVSRITTAIWQLSIHGL